MKYFTASLLIVAMTLQTLALYSIIPQLAAWIAWGAFGLHVIALTMTVLFLALMCDGVVIAAISGYKK